MPLSFPVTIYSILNGLNSKDYQDSIHCEILSNFHHDINEVLGANIRPKSFPHNSSNVIVPVVYQPPATDDVVMNDYFGS